MILRRNTLNAQAHQVVDMLLLALALYIAYGLRGFVSPYIGLTRTDPFVHYLWLYAIILPLGLALLNKYGFYALSETSPPIQVIAIATKSLALCDLVVLASIFALRQDQVRVLSRPVLIAFAAVAVALLVSKQLLWRVVASRISENVHDRCSVILVGYPQDTDRVSALLNEHKKWRLTPIRTLPIENQLVDKLILALHQSPVDFVIFTTAKIQFSDLQKAVLACETEGVDVWVMADYVETTIARTSVDHFDGKPVIVFQSTPEWSWSLFIKRVIDVTASLVGLAVLGPLVMIPAAIAIKLTSRGPILFKQIRCGLHGRLFTMYKFRSMVENAETLRESLQDRNEMSGPVFKLSHDPRITQIGGFLRKTSIDELPQLFNVLRGEMSLVGPRPPIPSEVTEYDPWHRRRLSMRPGITCLWQVSGRNNVNFKEWMELDLQYIDSWSLWLDLKLLAQTLPAVLFGRGAH